jgi:hypothetical protein
MIPFVIGSSPVQALTITTTDDANTLINEIVGSGITFSNGSFVGTSTSAGTFSNGLSSGIGIDKGIILTTGNANLAPGPNDSDSAGASLGLPGDSDLSNLIGGSSTYDANILSFDFESDSGDVFFKFAFASEEYNEYVGSGYNDVFGFFLNGQNIALIPNTNTPVAINNVNNITNSSFYLNVQRRLSL